MDVRSLKAHTFLILLDRWDWIMSRIAFTSNMMRNACAHDDELERVLVELNGGNDDKYSCKRRNLREGAYLKSSPRTLIERVATSDVCVRRRRCFLAILPNSSLE